MRLVWGGIGLEGKEGRREGGKEGRREGGSGEAFVSSFF